MKEQAVRTTVDIPASYLDYFRKLDGLGIKLSPEQRAWYVKKAEQHRAI